MSGKLAEEHGARIAEGWWRELGRLWPMVVTCVLLVVGCSAPGSTSGPSSTEPPPSAAPSVAWETVLQLGPVTDVVVTGGAFESPGRYLLVATCQAPGTLRMTTDDGPITYLCTSDGAPGSHLVASGRRGRTVIDVDSGPLSTWQVLVQVPPG